jgi:hypothetical protein
MEAISMKRFRFARWLVLALLLSLIPATSNAGVFISVGFAPPVLPVYVQPPCPQPGLMWVPGYWAYGPDGYYWVPGEWVPAPYDGALWTPGYWGWMGGLYVWHPGYWGLHVGYYGGVDYGFGYFGIGFVGGMWHGHDFMYNTAVMHVGGNIHSTYMDRGIVSRYTVAANSHVAFSGGPGGIRHAPTAEENTAMHEQHMGRTSFQTQHVNAAMHDRSAYFNNNHGRPSTPAASGSINYNASKSNTGNVTAHPASQNSGSGGGRVGTVNYNASKSNSVNAQTRTYNASHSNTYTRTRAVNNTTTRSNTQHNVTAPAPQSHGGSPSHPTHENGQNKDR